jgi:putative transposase
MAHPPRIPVLLDDATPVIYFLTICVDKRLPVLANQKAWVAIDKAVAKLDKWHTLALLAMPDHIHALIAPVDRQASPGTYSGWIKRWIRAELEATWHWQPGCFDRLLRNNENAQQKWAYVRENPVTAGLVDNWQQWPYQMGFRDLM